MKPSLLILTALLLGIAWCRFSESQTVNRELGKQVEEAEDDPMLTALGTNANDEVPESSGLAASTHIENAIWTINDSGHPCNLFLLKTSGELIGRVQLRNAKNLDWEAMAQFEFNDVSYLAVADVGDNGRRRTACQIYLLREPKLEIDDKAEPDKRAMPIQKVVDSEKLEFTYPGGPRDCEALAVDVLAKQIWLTEKVFYNAPRSEIPGIFVLPLDFAQRKQPLVARRIADFPIRSVTGMAFSADGKRLIIRNYLNAHLYSRAGDESWESVVSKTRPQTVVLPLQRQGEAICFTPDSKSILLTSEVKRQPIWQVSLQKYLDRTADDQLKPAPKSSKVENK